MDVSDVEWTPAARRLVLPRNPPRRARLKPDQSERLLAQVREELTPRWESWTGRLLRLAPEDSRRLDQLCREAQGRVEDWTVESQSLVATAAGLHLVQTAVAGLVRLWAQLKGAAFALEVAVRSYRSSPWARPFQEQALAPVWAELRRESLSPDDVARAFEKADFPLACGLAVACPTDPSFACRAAAGWTPAQGPPLGWWLVTSLPPEETRRLVSGALPPSALAYDLVEALGAEAAPVLRRGLEETSEPSEQLTFALALELLKTPQAARAFADFLERPDAPPRLGRRQSPTDIAHGYVSAHAQLLADGPLAPPGPEPETAEGLPDLLVNPPWKKKPARKGKRVGLTVALQAPALGQPARSLLDELEDVLEGLSSFPETAPRVADADYASPHLAAPMAQSLRRPGKLQALAAAWFDSHPEAAMHGLVPVLAGPDGKLRDQCLLALRRLRGAGHSLREAARAYGLEAELAPWLGPFDPAREADQAELPRYLTPAACRPPRLRHGGAVPGAAAAHLAELLSLCGPDRSPSLDEVKAALEPDSLDRFAADLLAAWVSEGCPPGQRWMMQAAGQVGGSECARRLAGLVKAWPGESAHQRAQEGLETLLRMGHVEALAGVHDLACFSRYPAQRKAARQGFEAEARRRGLSWDELADLAVPTLGLSPEGVIELDSGQRLALTAACKLEPAVPGELTKLLAELVRTQSGRLEQAMIRGRTWTSAEFQARILGHPVLRRLAAGLLWEMEERRFRLAEDGTFADVEERLLASGGPVRLPHPLHLEDAELEAWRTIWSDYELLPPFPQLNRPVFRASPEELESGEVRRFEGRKVAGGRLFGLQSRGWQPENIDEHLDRFARDGATLYFSPGLQLDVRSAGPQVMGPLTIPALSPVEFSELLLDVDSL